MLHNLLHIILKINQNSSEEDFDKKRYLTLKTSRSYLIIQENKKTFKTLAS